MEEKTKTKTYTVSQDNKDHAKIRIEKINQQLQE